MLTFPFIGLVLLTFVSVAAVPCNVLAWPFLSATANARAQTRAPLVLLFIAAPWMLGGGVLISSVADLFFGACDVGEMCLWNEDPSLVQHTRALVVLPLLLAFICVSAYLVQRLIVSRRAVTALDRTSRPDAQEPDLRRVPSTVALAFAARRKVFVSDGLHAALTAPELQAVLAHERAHLHRGDAVCQLIARVLSSALIPPLRRRALAALTLANEECCDQASAAATSNVITAAAILRVTRLTPAPAPSLVLSPAFAESFAPQRIRTLLSPERPPMSPVTMYATILSALLCMFLVGDLLYYGAMLLLYPSSFG